MKYLAIKIFQIILIGILISIPYIEVIICRNLKIIKQDHVPFIIIGAISCIGIIAIFVKSFEKEN